MRVLMIHSRYQHRGGEDICAETDAQMLRDAGHVVETLTFSSADWTPGLSAVRRALWNRDAARRTRQAIEQARPDILHLHNLFPAASLSVLAAAVASGQPVVAHLHNARLLCPGGTLWRQGRVCTDCAASVVPGVAHGCWRDSRAATAVAALAVRRWSALWQAVTLFVSPSEFLKATLAPVIPPDRVRVVPNALFPEPETPETPEAGGGAGPGPDRSGVLFVGRMVPEKGLPVLLEAWKRLAVDCPLTIVGDGPLLPRIKTLAAADPSLHLLGALPHAEGLAQMRRAKVVVVPSQWPEPFGRVALEAMACGAAVVATDSGGLPEIIGPAGVLAPVGSVAGLADAIRSALEQSLPLGLAAQDRYRRLFSPHASRLEAVYQDAIQRKAGDA